MYIYIYLCLPPSVTREVYCFPFRQLIFSFGRRVIYHSKGLWEYISKYIPSVCLCVCTSVFKRIAGLRVYSKSLMLYINRFVSTSSTNQLKFFFSKFKFVFELMAEKSFFKISNSVSEFWLKTEKYPNSLIYILCISMNLVRQALQTNGKLL